MIYDERFDAGRSFGAEARRHGANVHAIRGLVHDLWYDDLYPRWKASPHRSRASRRMIRCSCSRWAQDVRLHVVFRAHHRSADGTVVHEAFGPAAALARMPALGGTASEWGSTSARIVTSWPAGARSRARADSSILDASDRMVSGDTLITWVIAPAVRATPV